MPSRMSGSGRDALPDVRQLSRGPTGCPAVVGTPSRLSGSGREALPNVREWSGCPPGCQGVVGVALPEVREWSGGLPGCSGVVGRTSRMSGSGREALPDVQEFS